MNSLNSVLLEGYVTKTRREGEGILKIEIISERSYRKDDDYVTDARSFNIYVVNKLADSCEKHLSEGRGLRVVGRLDCKQVLIDGKVSSYVETFVIAEHVEFKPVSSNRLVSVGDAS